MVKSVCGMWDKFNTRPEGQLLIEEKWHAEKGAKRNRNLPKVLITCGGLLISVFHHVTPFADAFTLYDHSIPLNCSLPHRYVFKHTAGGVSFRTFYFHKNGTIWTLCNYTSVAAQRTSILYLRIVVIVGAMGEVVEGEPGGGVWWKNR